MKTHKCAIQNNWSTALNKAAILVRSPKGGSVYIRRIDCDLLEDAQWAVVEKCSQHTAWEIELTLEELKLLHSAAIKSLGVITAAPKPQKKSEAKGSGTGVAAPQTGLKAQPQKSYAQRKFEKSKRIQADNQKILGGCCPSCNSTKLKVKRHAGWIGYYCNVCKGGGSLTLKK